MRATANISATPQRQILTSTCTGCLTSTARATDRPETTSSSFAAAARNAPRSFASPLEAAAYAACRRDPDGRPSSVTTNTDVWRFATTINAVAEAPQRPETTRSARSCATGRNAGRGGRTMYR